MNDIPKIRFKGFTEEWEQRKLGEVYNFQYGEFNNNPDNGGKYPVYGANGIIGGYTNFNAEDSSIIGHMGAYAGYVVWAAGKHFVTYNGTIAKPSDNSLDSKFGYYILSQKKIYRICAGSGQPFVSYADLNGIDVEIPKDKNEQVKIGTYFSNLDYLITLHQRKYDEITELKKYMLKKMFPVKGKNTPEIRFTGFTEEWEQCKLGKLLEFRNGFNGGADRYGTGIPLISVMDILNNDFITNENIRTKADMNEMEFQRFKVEYGDILFQRSSENINDAGTSNVYMDKHKNAAFGGFVICGKKKLEYNPLFMRYGLDNKNVRAQIISKAQGAQHINVTQNTLQEVEIFIPSQQEQEKIGTYFFYIDHLLALHQQKFDELTELKKYMLQNMFPKKEG